MNSNSKTHDRLGLSGPRSSSTRSSATLISCTLALEHEEKSFFSQVDQGRRRSGSEAPKLNLLKRKKKKKKKNKNKVA
jgi:hypothetical protein